MFWSEFLLDEQFRTFTIVYSDDLSLWRVLLSSLIGWNPEFWIENEPGDPAGYS